MLLAGRLRLVPSAARTLLRLGLIDVVRVLRFRSRLKRSGYPLQVAAGNPLEMPIWRLRGDAVSILPASAPDRHAVEEMLAGRYHQFASEPIALAGDADWFASCELGCMPGRTHWSAFYLDPEAVTGDIKAVWDRSRFTWAIGLARACVAGGDLRCQEILNRLVDSWWRINPPDSFPNWSCGQETSLRLMAICLADQLLEEANLTSGDRLISLVEAHCRRIEETLDYAIGQRNNHSVAEAAGLFVGGAWLASRVAGLGKQRQALAWRAQGVRLLESSVRKLILADGSFALLSPTYHRAVLDTLAVSIAMGARSGAPGFSPIFFSRARAAAAWLQAVAIGASNDAPNLGGNDGSLMLDALDGNYRDFVRSGRRMERLCAKPSLEHIVSLWSSHDNVAGQHDRVSKQFPQGGLALLHRGQWAAAFRYARAIFRPQHLDSLHVDLWDDGACILCDGGSYDYADVKWAEYFTGPQGHNVIEFDGAASMRRLGRFLFLDWINARLDAFDQLGSVAEAYQRDYRRYTHARKVCLQDDHVEIRDRITGSFKQAVLRWRLAAGQWIIEEGRVCSPRYRIEFDISAITKRLELVEGWISIRYGERQPIQVLELELAGPGEIRTIITRI